MMKLGIHAYAWCTKWSNSTLSLIDKCADVGVDFIEIPLIDLDLFDARAISDRLQQRNLDAVTSTVLSKNTDISSTDKTIWAQGIQYLKDCVKATADIGATSFSGVIYSEFARKEHIAPTQENWDCAANALREVAIYAEDVGVTVGIEPVNRYETNLINTAAQGVQLKTMIDRPNIRIHLDTYHMNIEEKNFYDATMLAGKDLIHYHLCENDRGIPGTGTVHWDDIFRALKDLHYKGYAGLENFVGLGSNYNTWVWRELAPSGDVLLSEGLKFMKSLMKKYNLE